MPAKSRTTPDHYAEITAKVIEALEAGTPPWRRPWDEGKAGGPCMPQNAVTGARYRGINVLTLGMSHLAFASGDPRWATYKQAQERGWQVRRGARSVTGFFYKRIEIENGAGATNEGAGEGGKWVPLLRSFALFHASDIDGIPAYVAPTVEEAPWREPQATKTILRNSGAQVRIGGERAFYSALTDHIQLPPAFAFRSPAALASVQLHEMAHWSGADNRLKRDLSGKFGSALYAQEELRGELAQLMLCSELGIEECDFTNGAAYLSHWLEKLRSDKREIFRAAADAQRIADYLLAFHPDYATPAAAAPRNRAAEPLKVAA